MASRLPHASISDVLVVNKSINHLRNTHGRPLKIWRLDPDEMSFLAISDAGGINTKDEELDSALSQYISPIPGGAYRRSTSIENEFTSSRLPKT